MKVNDLAKRLELKPARIRELIRERILKGGPGDAATSLHPYVAYLSQALKARGGDELLAARLRKLNASVRAEEFALAREEASVVPLALALATIKEDYVPTIIGAHDRLLRKICPELTNRSREEIRTIIAADVRSMLHALAGEPAPAREGRPHKHAGFQRPCGCLGFCSKCAPEKTVQHCQGCELKDFNLVLSCEKCGAEMEEGLIEWTAIAIQEPVTIPGMRCQVCGHQALRHRHIPRLKAVMEDQRGQEAR